MPAFHSFIHSASSAPGHPLNPFNTTGWVNLQRLALVLFRKGRAHMFILTTVSDSIRDSAYDLQSP